MKRTTMTAVALASAVLVLPGCRREPAPAETARTEPAAQAVDDAWITTRVEAQYFVNPEVKAREIDVTTHDGVVTLTGIVDSQLARDRAVTIARETDGVTRVDDRMAVKLPGQVATTGTSSDGPDATAAAPAEETPGEVVESAWTTTKIQAAYFADPDIKGRNIDVTTRDRVVTLAGEVDNDAQRRRAVEIARTTAGVTDVQDRLRVAGAAAPAAAATPATAAPSTTDESATDAGIVARVQSKFYQHDNLRPSRIDVSAKDGVVTLSGSVASESRKRDAVAVARNTDGVTEVRDELTVDATVPPLPGTEAVKDAAVEASTAASDAWLTTQIQASFYLDPDIKGRNIDVGTEQGVVTLSGDVASTAARDRAVAIARDTDGVKRVVDELAVKAAGRR
jgi:hyperosmotically inducible periplasmic protein